MYNRLLSFSDMPKKSAFLFGPRGTGKSFWIRQNFKQAIIIDLLKSDVYRTLLNDPSRLSSFIPPDFSDWVVIDEVQKIPELLDEVHHLIENKGINFLLTGSSARKLKAGAANLLAGRARVHHMHPLTIQEVQDDFSLPKALCYGMMPEVFSCKDPISYLHSYVGTYLQEEILQEGILRKTGDFSHFLEIASFSQGEILNFSNIAREIGVSRKTVASYFDITIDLLLGSTLPVFTRQAKRQLTAQPKFYFFDVGIYRALRPSGPMDSVSEIDGHALETLVFQHLQAINDAFQLRYQFYYWRTRHGIEVDFIAYGKNGFLAIEVKRKKQVKRADLKGLRAFLSDYPMATGLCFYGGSLVEYHDNITLYPIEEALKKLPELLGSPQASQKDP